MTVCTFHFLFQKLRNNLRLTILVRASSLKDFKFKKEKCTGTHNTTLIFQRFWHFLLYSGRLADNIPLKQSLCDTIRCMNKTKPQIINFARYSIFSTAWQTFHTMTLLCISALASHLFETYIWHVQANFIRLLFMVWAICCRENIFLRCFKSLHEITIFAIFDCEFDYTFRRTWTNF